MSSRLRTAPDRVEALLDRIAFLVAERQELRAQNAEPGLLERNRRELVEAHRGLSDALIERHAGIPEQDAA